jgi:hypothetical protein
VTPSPVVIFLDPGESLLLECLEVRPRSGVDELLFVAIYSGATRIGTSEYAQMNRSNGYDLGLVNIGNSTNQARIYVDPLSTTKTVVSSASSMVFNATYCSSGSVTLGKCNRYTSGTQSNSLGWWVVDLQRVAEFNNTPGVSTYLICQGDSGGPIFYYPGNDRSGIVAAGIVSTTAQDVQVWIGDRNVGCSTTGEQERRLSARR